MPDDEATSITLRLPKSLRERIKAQARREERTESQFVRYHIARLLKAERRANRQPVS
jgi:predicted DNA-binding protein